MMSTIVMHHSSLAPIWILLIIDPCKLFEKKLDQTLIEMLREMVDEESALITLYSGKDVKPQEAKIISEKVMDAFPDMEVELQEGGQPVYYYVISVE